MIYLSFRMVKAGVDEELLTFEVIKSLLWSFVLGDVCQKPYISGDADGDSFELTGSEDYLLLACDGFFDAIKPYEVVDLVLDHLMQTKGVGLKAAERLVAAAKENGSSDNITVLVVFLRDPQDILADCLRDTKSLGAGDDAQGSPFNFLSCEAAATQWQNPQRSKKSSVKEPLSTEEASNTIGKTCQEEMTNGQTFNKKPRLLFLSSHLSFPSLPLPSKTTEQTWRFVQLFCLWEQNCKMCPRAAGHFPLPWRW